MEYCTLGQEKLIQTEKGTRGKKKIMENCGDLLESASQSTSPAHNRKWKEEFHTTIILER